MKLSKVPFEKILDGTKVIESRLYDEKRKLIDIGDLIEFSQNDSENNKCTVEVVGLLRYANFSDLFSDFEPRYFGGKSEKELLLEIENFYSKEDQKQYGVLGIKIKKI